MADPKAPFNFKAFMEEVLLDLEATYDSIKQRGARYFARPLLITAGAVLLTYRFFFLPPGVKLANLEKKFTAAATTLQFADRYTGVRDTLLAIYNQLPANKDRDRWLVDAIIDTLRVNKLTSEAMSQPVEFIEGGLITQTIAIDTSLTFKDMLLWLKEVEDRAPIIHVESLIMKKKDGAPGDIMVSLHLSTIIVQRRKAP